jgi:hypothetical protein
MNNKKQFFSKLFLLGLGIGIVLGVNHIYAGNWNAPTASFPSGNVDAPINTGIQSQVKSGSLTVLDLMVNRGLEVGSAEQAEQSALQVNSLSQLDGGIITSSIAGTGISQFQNVILTDLTSSEAGDTKERSVCTDSTGKIIECTYSSPNEGTLTPFKSSQDYYKSYNIGDVIGDTTNAIYDGSIFYKKIDDMVFLDVKIKFKTNFEDTGKFVAYFPASLPKPLKKSESIPVVITEQSLISNLGDESEANYMGNVSIEEKWGAVVVTLEPVGLKYFKDNLFDKSKGFNHYIPISFQYFY